MEKLTIINIDNNYVFLVNNKTEKVYRFFIKLLNTNFQLQVGDKLLMHNNLLNQNYIEYSDSMYFGPVDSDFGRIENLKEEDIISVKHNNKTINLKRYFG